MLIDTSLALPLPYHGARAGRIQAAFCIWAALTALPLLTLGTAGFAAGYSMYLTLLAAALTLPLLLHGVDRPFDLLEPIWAVSAVYALEFLIKPVLLLRDPLTYQLPYLRYVEPAMLQATWMGVMGFCAFYLGYESGVPGALAMRLPKLGWPWREERAWTALVAGAVAFALIVIHFVAKGNFDIAYMYGNRLAINAGDEDLSFAMHLLAWILVAIAFALYLMWPVSKNLLRLLLTTAAVMVCMFPFAARMSLLFVVVGLMVLRHYTVKRMDPRWAVAAAAVLFVLAAAFGVFRSNYLRPTFSWSDALGEDLTATMEDELKGYCDWDVTATVVDYYPAHRQFYHGRLALESVYYLIPRRLWTGKPIWYGSGRIENDISPNLLTVRDEGGFNGSAISQSALGEGYADLGVAGAALYMFIYGCYWSWIYGLLRANAFRLPGAMMFAPAFVYLPMVLRSFSSTIIDVSIWVLAMYQLCAWLGGVEPAQQTDR